MCWFLFAGFYCVGITEIMCLYVAIVTNLVKQQGIFLLKETVTSDISFIS